MSLSLEQRRWKFPPNYPPDQPVLALRNYSVQGASCQNDRASPTPCTQRHLPTMPRFVNDHKRFVEVHAPAAAQ